MSRPRCHQHHVPITGCNAISTRLRACWRPHPVDLSGTTRSARPKATSWEVTVLIEEGPTLRRRRLGSELKKRREEAGLTQEQVSRHFEWHAAKVTRIETARVAVTPRDVKDLLTLYDVRDQEYRDALIELARLSRERTWWTDYRDIMRPGNFIGLEAGASAMRAWEPIILPGLLQTEGYMRALLRTGRPYDSPEALARRVALRLTRQSRL